MYKPVYTEGYEIIINSKMVFTAALVTTFSYTKTVSSAVQQVLDENTIDLLELYDRDGLIKVKTIF